MTAPRCCRSSPVGRDRCSDWRTVISASRSLAGSFSPPMPSTSPPAAACASRPAGTWRSTASRSPSIERGAGQEHVAHPVGPVTASAEPGAAIERRTAHAEHARGQVGGGDEQGDLAVELVRIEPAYQGGELTVARTRRQEGGELLRRQRAEAERECGGAVVDFAARDAVAAE